MPNLAHATALRDSGGLGRYGIDLDAEWTANGHCTAGYLASVVTRAVLQDPRAPFPVVVAVNARYLRVTSPGYATVEVDPLHVGTGGAHWRVTLHAGGQVCVAGLITTGHEIRSRQDGAAAGATRPGPLRAVAESGARFRPAGHGSHASVRGPGRIELARRRPERAGTSAGMGAGRGWIDPCCAVTRSGVRQHSNCDLRSRARGLGGDRRSVGSRLGSPVPGPLPLRRRVRETAGTLVTLACDMWDADSSLVATGLQLCSLRR